MKQSEIDIEIEELIGKELYEKYSHLSYVDMAEMDELSEYADDLRQAEKDWFEAEDA